MMWQKFKKEWDAMPFGLKRVIGFTASVVAFFAELILEAKDKPVDDKDSTKERDLYREQLFIDYDGDVTYEDTGTRYLPEGK